MTTEQKPEGRNVGLSAGLDAGGEHDWKDEWDGATYIGPPNPPPKKMQVAARLRVLATEMDELAVAMDYYGGLAEWSQHAREISGAGAIARQWADEIETSNAVAQPTACRSEAKASGSAGALGWA